MSSKSLHTDPLLFLNSREKSLASRSNLIYSDSVKGYLGMSNLHSAGSLMNSVKSYSIGNEVKLPLKPYEGIDSFEYQPETSFISKNIYNQKKLFQKERLKGASIGKGDKSDFTKEQRLIPGANKYQSSPDMTVFRSFDENQRKMVSKNQFVKGTIMGLGDKSDFTKSQLGLPAPNQYKQENQHIFDQSKKIKTDIGMGNKYDFTKEKRYIPAPNVYEQPSQFYSPQISYKVQYSKGKGMVPGYSVSTGQRYDFTRETRGFPSPSQYKSFQSDFINTNDSNNMKIYKGLGSVPGAALGKGEKYDFTKAQKYQPSPAEYQDQNNISQFKDRYTQVLNCHKWGGSGVIKGYSFGNGNRSDFTKEGRKIPGPGAYTRPILLDKYDQQKQQSKRSEELTRLLTQNYSMMNSMHLKK